VHFSDSFARSRGGRSGGVVGTASEPTGFAGQGFFVELPAQMGNFFMTGVGTFVIYPVLFYAQGLFGGFSSDRSWATASRFATYTFGYFGYYLFGTPCWLVKKTIWDAPMFCLGMFI